MSKETAQEALTRAVSSPSVMNYAAIIVGFTAKGIPESEIKPRENVFTFQAWIALGRCVRKGEHGVKVCTFVPMTITDKETGEKKSIGNRPRNTTVFHVSQTTELADHKPIARNEFFKSQNAEIKNQKIERAEKAEDYYSTEFTPIK